IDQPGPLFGGGRPKRYPLAFESIDKVADPQEIRTYDVKGAALSRGAARKVHEGARAEVAWRNRYLLVRAERSGKYPSGEHCPHELREKVSLVGKAARTVR